MAQLRITEIFHSLQGESRSVGFPTVFVRLTGCPLRCTYCDTSYAFKGGAWITLSEIQRQVAAFGARHVTVTGGEPLAQDACISLLSLLCDEGYEVSLETGGALDVSEVDTRVIKVMDLKTPSSGESERNLYANVDYLNPLDQVKFVICDLPDYRWAMQQIERLSLTQRCEVLFSPTMDTQEPRKLAEWILRDRLPVRFQIQLHKLLWDGEPGR